MILSGSESRLMAAMQEFDIVDAHEHLPPEEIRLGQPQDVFTLFSHYTPYDLFSAGMREASLGGLLNSSVPVLGGLVDPSVPLEERWRIFRPYWDNIRHGSYARAASLTAKLVYGVDDITDATYHVLSERIAAENTVGIYQRVFDRCRIRAVLTQCGHSKVEFPLVPILPVWTFAPVGGRERIEKLATAVGADVPVRLDGYVDLVRRHLDDWVANGVVGLKLHCRPYQKPDATVADAAYRRLIDGVVPGGAGQVEDFALTSYIVHSAIDMAAARSLTIAVHAGIWNDFREIDCRHLLPLAPSHPAATFDLYHLGMPEVRSAIVIAKNLPNVNLNLCWTHIISQAQARSGIDELIDQVPMNKVIAFGGDYNRPVEKIVGHLHMAREDFAVVFGSRVDRGLMDFDEAVGILRNWFWDNPLRLYRRLKVL